MSEEIVETPDTRRTKRVDAFEVAAGMPWMITAEGLAQILTIADRAMTESVEALETRLGRKLDNTRSVTMREGIAVVPVTGPIFRYANLMTELSGATSTAQLALDIQQAIDDPDVKGIVLNIDSPGGAAQGINELAEMIAACSRGNRKRKRMKAYVGGTAGSAAYWIASAAEEIVMDAMAMAGSIGVVMTVQDTTKRDMKRDVRDIEIVSSVSPEKRVDINTESGRGKVQKIVDDMAAVFISSVARNRGVSEEKVKGDFGRGGLVVGARAVEAGMADRIGSLESLIEEMVASANPMIIRRSAMAKEAKKGPVSVSSTAELLAAVEAGHTADEITIADTRAASATAERERIRAILTHEEAGGRLDASMHLALETDMGAEQAVALLAKIPKNQQKQAAQSDFQKAMATLSPGVASIEVTDDQPKVPKLSHTDIYSERAKARAAK